jgi:hypothetical protein
MFKKITLAAAVAATALTMVPGAAEARGRYYNDGYYSQGYSQGYGQGYYGNAYNRGYSSNYNRGYGNNYYGRTYRDYSNGYRRCSGTTGTIVGGVAGALLGREIARSGSRGYYRRGGGGTTGAILGGALGALAGRAVDKSSCRDRY